MANNDKQTIGPSLNGEDNLSSVKSVELEVVNRIATVMFYDEEQNLVEGYWNDVDGITIEGSTIIEEMSIDRSIVRIIFPDDNGVPTTANGAAWIIGPNYNKTIVLANTP